MKKLVFALIAILCYSCASPTIIIKKDVPIEKLGVYLEVANTAMPVISSSFDRQLDEFINTYNADARHRLKLFRASATDSSTLKIKLVASSLVTPGQQAAGVFVTLAGLALPIAMASAEAPFFVTFYYFPNVKSLTELSVTDDIAPLRNEKKDFVLASPGFLISTEKQIDKHVIYFDKFLNALVNQIEKQAQVKKVGTVAGQQ